MKGFFAWMVIAATGVPLNAPPPPKPELMTTPSKALDCAYQNHATAP
jgi:hypothetical protein